MMRTLETAPRWKIVVRSTKNRHQMIFPPPPNFKGITVIRDHQVKRQALAPGRPAKAKVKLVSMRPDFSLEAARALNARVLFASQSRANIGMVRLSDEKK